MLTTVWSQRRLDSDILCAVWEKLETELAEQGFELVEVEYGRHGGSYILRLFLDRDGGITLDQCAQASRFIGPFLDRLDVMDGRYMLEVSSPGIERPVRKPADFLRFKGERIKLRTLTPIQGRSRFKGTLTGYDDGLINIECEGATHRIHIENVKKANLDR